MGTDLIFRGRQVRVSLHHVCRLLSAQIPCSVRKKWNAYLELKSINRVPDQRVATLQEPRDVSCLSKSGVEKMPFPQRTLLKIDA